MITTHPPNYWDRVFKYAAYLVKAREGMSGETAYNLAKQIVGRDEDKIPAPEEKKT